MFERLWLKALGGNAAHAGLGVMTLAFLVALVGALIAFCASSASPSGVPYWLGYVMVVMGIVGGWCGMIYHRILLRRGDASHRSDP